VKISPQGIISSEKASNSPGLCPVKEQEPSLGTPDRVPKLALEPFFGCHQDLAFGGIMFRLAEYLLLAITKIFE